MNKTNFSILITSLVVLIYVILSTIPVAFGLVFGMMALSQALLVWMVITILKDPKPSVKRFDEYYYEDADIRSDGADR